MTDVTIGRRFGGEAFFFRKKFFCHFHPIRDHVFLETFVGNKLNDVVKQVPGVIPHPEYSNYGWARLPIVSESNALAGLRLVDLTYLILRTSKRVSIRKEKFSQESLDSARDKLKQLNFNIKKAKKTIQVLIEAPTVADFDESDALLEKAVKMLKG